jgi:hypothetical protein
LNEFRRKAEKELRYQDAKRARIHLKVIAERELERQKINMENAQRQEYQQIAHQ